MSHLDISQIKSTNEELYSELSESIYLLDMAKQASSDATANHLIDTAIEKMIQLRNSIGSGDLYHFPLKTYK